MKLFYWLTTYYPRLLPRTESGWDRMRAVLIKYYGVPDHLEVWITVAGQVVATPPSRVRRSWGYFANVGKRVRANKVIHDEKMKMMRVLSDRLKKIAEEEAARANAESTAELGKETPKTESDQTSTIGEGICPALKIPQNAFPDSPLNSLQTTSGG